MKASCRFVQVVICVLLCSLGLSGCAIDMAERDDGAPATWSGQPMRHDRMWNPSVEDNPAATNPFID
jgi:hypothetical protein